MTQTNLGEHKIGAKAYNPVWHIPKSIQKERNDGVKSVPAGPNNPLGPVFVRLGDPKLSLGIHGTNAPASVPGVRSHGCVRMKSPDALEFAKTIATGSPASVIYQMASLNEDANQNLWLAAYRDPASEPKQSVRPTPVKPAKPAAKPVTTPADAPASAPKAASEPATAPASSPVKDAPASSEPTDLLF